MCSLLMTLILVSLVQYNSSALHKDKIEVMITLYIVISQKLVHDVKYKSH